MSISYRMSIGFVGETLAAGGFACAATIGSAALTLGSASLDLTATRFSVPVTVRNASLTSSAEEPATSGGIAVTTLRGGSSGVQPATFGMAFAEGDLASGSEIANCQTNVITTWPDDGSAKTAIVSCYATITAGTDRPVALVIGAAATGATVTTSALAAVTALHDCGTFGTVSWGSADWATPHVTVCTGPVMSSWLYRKAVGSDAHLVAWLEVRAFSGGEVQVLPWLENGYVAVASPTNKSATYGFSLNGVTKCSAVAIDIKHHQRTPLINGTSLWYWTGTDPGIVPIHDAAYLMSTELVPSYYSSLAGGDSKVTALPSTYVPLQQGSFAYDSDAMTSNGYQRPIGLLPEHDVLHLVAADSDRATTFKAVVRNGFSAGRYPIHYRDEATNKLLKFSEHPNRVIADGAGFASNGSSTTGSRTPTPAGTSPPVWDTAHSPSVGYMAHLLTGLRYFLEEAQFAATCNYLGNGDNSDLRNGSQGLMQTAVSAWQTRASAWDWRAHCQALAITPSTDQIYADLVNRAHSNVDYFWSTYVNQANNQFGFILPGEDGYNGTISRIAIWQQDMVTAAWGYAKSLGLPLDATRTTRLDAFFDWKAQSIVGRLGTVSTFPFENANRYDFEIGTTLSINSYKLGTGPWPADWASMYASTTPLENPPSTSLATAGGNVLATEYDATSAAKGQWGTLQQAIAYAVRHGVSGASAAYNRMIGATNWASMLTANFAASYPVMGVKPYTDPVALPAWRSSMAVNEIKNLASTADTQGAALNAWGTLPLIDGTSTLVSPANGGHGDSSDNRVTSLDLSQATPAWTIQIAASASVQTNVEYYADGKPASRHGYAYALYISQRSRVMMFGARGLYGNGNDGLKVASHTVSGTWAWDAEGTFAASPLGYGTVRDPDTGNVMTNGGRLWDQAANTWSTLGGFTGGWRYPVAYDSTRGKFFALQWGDGGPDSASTGVFAQQFTKAGVGTTISFNASSAYTQFQADGPRYAGMDYDPMNDCFLFYAGQTFSGGSVASNVPTRIYKITPNGTSTWDMSLLTVTGDTPANVVAGGSGINGRWRYIPALSGFYCQPAASTAGWFLRTS